MGGWLSGREWSTEQKFEQSLPTHQSLGGGISVCSDWQGSGTRQGYGQLNQMEWDETLSDSGASNMFMFLHTGMILSQIPVGCASHVECLLKRCSICVAKDITGKKTLLPLSPHMQVN